MCCHVQSNPGTWAHPMLCSYGASTRRRDDDCEFTLMQVTTAYVQRAVLLEPQKWLPVAKRHTGLLAGSERLVISCTKGGPCTPVTVCWTMPSCRIAVIRIAETWKCIRAAHCAVQGLKPCNNCVLRNSTGGSLQWHCRHPMPSTTQLRGIDS